MIRVLQYRGKSAISTAIKIFTFSEFSHTAALNTQTGEIIEAWQGGVRKRTLKDHGHTKGTVVDVYRPLCCFDQEKFWRMMQEEVGSPYDYRGILGFLARRETQSQEAWFCSELVFSCLAQSGLLLLNAPAYKVYPTMISYSPLLAFERRITLL